MLSIKVYLGFLQPPTGGTNLNMYIYSYADNTLLDYYTMTIAQVGRENPDAAAYAHVFFYVGTYVLRCQSLVLAVHPSTGAPYLRTYHKAKFVNSAMTHAIVSSLSFSPYGVSVPSSQVLPTADIRRLL